MAAAPILCLGEIVIDLIGQPNGPLDATASFLPRVGGAPANVAVGLSRLGVSAGFAGSVAADGFAELALRRLASEGVGLEGVTRAPGTQTRIAVVVGPAGNRSFTFYGHPAADSLLTPDAAVAALGADVRALYLGSLPLTAEPSRSALLATARAASARGIPICFDPNPRGPQWGKGGAARDALVEIARIATVMKLSTQDLALLGVDGRDTPALAPSAGVVVVTDGARGCDFWAGGRREHVPATRVESHDEVGAGDAFMAALIARGIAAEFRFTREDVEFASMAGALATTAAGAMDALPTLETVERAMRGAAGSA